MCQGPWFMLHSLISEKFHFICKYPSSIIWLWLKMPWLGNIIPSPHRAVNVWHRSDTWLKTGHSFPSLDIWNWKEMKGWRRKVSVSPSHQTQDVKPLRAVEAHLSITWTWRQEDGGEEGADTEMRNGGRGLMVSKALGLLPSRGPANSLSLRHSCILRSSDSQNT